VKGSSYWPRDWEKDTKPPKLTTFYLEEERLSRWLSLAREVASYFRPEHLLILYVGKVFEESESVIEPVTPGLRLLYASPPILYRTLYLSTSLPKLQHSYGQAHSKNGRDDTEISFHRQEFDDIVRDFRLPNNLLEMIDEEATRYTRRTLFDKNLKPSGFSECNQLSKKISY